jgi:hypothetical protein
MSLACKVVWGVLVRTKYPFKRQIEMFWVSFSRGKAGGSYSRSQEERRQLVQNWPNVTLQMQESTR